MDLNYPYRWIDQIPECTWQRYDSEAKLWLVAQGKVIDNVLIEQLLITNKSE